MLDQTERTRDLYFKVEIFSCCDFTATRLGKKYAYRYELPVPQLALSGGTPNDPFFYKNPQYVVQLDHSKFLDKAKVLQTNVDAVLSLTSNAGTDASVKLFLCKAGEDEISKGHRGRVFGVSERNTVTRENLKAAYKPGEFAMQCKLSGAKQYTAVVSTYDRSMPLGGTITLEADHAMIFAAVQDEGAGMVK